MSCWRSHDRYARNYDVTVNFSDFDTRGYRMVDVATGYGEWVHSYDDTVQDAMDIALLRKLSKPRWETVKRAADLGCGTGRTGAWLNSRGIEHIDGVDLTPEMLTVAGTRGNHAKLRRADVRDTGLDDGAYDLVIASLIDEHLENVQPLYREAWRISAADARFVLVVFHPHFMMMSGMPTHYTARDGEQIAITTNVHLISEHVAAASESGWRLVEMREAIIDEEWIAVKPKWARFSGHPISAAFVWSTT